MVDETTTAIEQDFLTYDSNTIQTPLIDCEKGDLMIIKVRKIAMINVDKLIALIREKKGKIYLDAKRPNFIIVDAKGIKNDERLDYISHTIDRLA